MSPILSEPSPRLDVVHNGVGYKQMRSGSENLNCGQHVGIHCVLFTIHTPHCYPLLSL